MRRFSAAALANPTLIFHRVAGRRAGISLLEVVVALAVIGLLAAILLPAIQTSREASRSLTCKSHFHQIGLANQNYEATHRIFAPGNTSGFSFHVSLLPFLDQQPLFSQVEFILNTADTEPNKDVIASRPAYLACPSDPDANDRVGTPYAATNYVGNYGVDYQRRGWDGFFRSLWTPNPNSPGPGGTGTYGHGPVTAGMVIDGLSQTAAFSEALVGTPRDVAPRGIYRTPYEVFQIDELRSFCRDVAAHPASVPTAYRGTPWTDGNASMTLYNHVSAPNEAACRNDTSVPEGTYPPSSLHPGGVHVCFGDAHVRFVNETIDITVWRAIGTRRERDLVPASF